MTTSSRTPLTERELADGLTTLPAWKTDAGSLVRHVEAPSFARALAWVNAIAGAAERADHHPDIHWCYQKLELRLRTHDRNAITSLDLRLAREIDDAIAHS